MENKKVKFKVNGIHCGGCANKIKTQLTKLSPEIESTVDVPAGIVSVTYPASTIKVSDIKAKLIEAGYGVESIELN